MGFEVNFVRNNVKLIVILNATNKMDHVQKVVYQDFTVKTANKNVLKTVKIKNAIKQLVTAIDVKTIIDGDNNARKNVKKDVKISNVIKKMGSVNVQTPIGANTVIFYVLKAVIKIYVIKILVNVLMVVKITFGEITVKNNVR